MTTQTHVCSVAGCPEPVTLMTSLNGNPMRAYCRTHGPVVYTVPAQPAPPAQPDPAARRVSVDDVLEYLERMSRLDAVDVERLRMGVEALAAHLPAAPGTEKGE